MTSKNELMNMFSMKRMMIRSSGKEIWKDRDDQESRSMGKDLAWHRESQGAFKKLGSVFMKGFLGIWI